MIFTGLLIWGIVGGTLWFVVWAATPGDHNSTEDFLQKYEASEGKKRLGEAMTKKLSHRRWMSDMYLYGPNVRGYIDPTRVTKQCPSCGAPKNNSKCEYCQNVSA